MNIEQIRADFEAWCAKQYPVLLTHVWTDNPDRYFSDYTQAAWEAWQARAALQSQDQVDAERYRCLSSMATQQADALGPIFRIDVRRPPQTLFNFDAAVDHARRIEGGET